MIDRRSLYLEHALSQLPRILSLQDRNPFSPTYGSFNRLYWLDKTHDFPDAMAQFAVQALALVYANDFPNGAGRYVQRGEGYDYTLVNGEVFMDHGEHTGKLCGRLLRSVSNR